MRRSPQQPASAPDRLPGEVRELAPVLGEIEIGAPRRFILGPRRFEFAVARICQAVFGTERVFHHSFRSGCFSRRRPVRRHGHIAPGHIRPTYVKSGTSREFPFSRTPSSRTPSRHGRRSGTSLRIHRIEEARSAQRNLISASSALLCAFCDFLHAGGKTGRSRCRHPGRAQRPPIPAAWTAGWPACRRDAARGVRYWRAQCRPRRRPERARALAASRRERL